MSPNRSHCSARVSARCLYDRHTGFQQASRFGILDKRNGHAILYVSAGASHFQLRRYPAGQILGQARQFNKRSTAYCRDEIRVAHAVSLF
jgi:hypothetical protein